MAATRIDCDIHPAVGGTRTTLLPYLDDHWKEQVVSRAIDGLDLTSYPPNMPLSGRPDWRPANGKPGGDPVIDRLAEGGGHIGIVHRLRAVQHIADRVTGAELVECPTLHHREIAAGLAMGRPPVGPAG